ncbi:MAG: matrixin family metalloprotease [Actinomycetota bacterium]
MNIPIVVRPRRVVFLVVLALLLTEIAIVVAIADTSTARKQPEFTITSNALSAPWATDFQARSTRLTVTSAASAKLTVRVWHDSRAVLTYSSVDDGEVLEFWIAKEHSGGHWYATVSADGLETSTSIFVAQRWAPLGADRTLPTPCSSVPWFLDSESSTEASSELLSSISFALDELSEASGLAFIRTLRKEEAQLTYSSVPLGPHGNPGFGGFDTTETGEYRGWIQLNSDFLGTQKADGSDAIGMGALRALTLHETAHALGLGHVVDPMQVMHPLPTRDGPTTLGEGDRAGLAWLYEPERCHE